jgi:type II secretory pathway component GspD/PulD (secretin)
MSALHLPAAVIALAVGLGLTEPPATAQERPKLSRKAPPIAPPVVRQVYPIHGGQAKELANALTMHFQSEPQFSVAPEPRSNSLLLSGPKPVLEEALGVLQQIDRPVRTVHVELFLVEFTGKATGETGSDSKEIDSID